MYHAYGSVVPLFSFFLKRAIFSWCLVFQKQQHQKTHIACCWSIVIIILPSPIYLYAISIIVNQRSNMFMCFFFFKKYYRKKYTALWRWIHFLSFYSRSLTHSCIFVFSFTGWSIHVFVFTNREIALEATIFCRPHCHTILSISASLTLTLVHIQPNSILFFYSLGHFYLSIAPVAGFQIQPKPYESHK